MTDTAARIDADGRDADAVRRILLDRQRLFEPVETSSVQGAAIQALVFMLAGERLALPLDVVRAVLPPARIAIVPGAPAGLLGVVACRGTILNLFDPSVHLGLSLQEPSGPSDEGGGSMILLRGPRPRVALRADRVLGVHMIEAPGSAAALVRPATDDEGHISLVDAGLLVDRLLSRPSFQER